MTLSSHAWEWLYMTALTRCDTCGLLLERRFFTPKTGTCTTCYPAQLSDSAPTS